MKKLLGTLAFLLAPVVLAHAAPITNGGFETGDLSGWSSIGDASVVGTVFGIAPAEGFNQAVITNSPAWTYGFGPPSELIQPISGTPSADDTFSIESFFGIPRISLSEAVGGGIILGQLSGLKTTFHAESGDQLSFQWNLLFTLWPYPGLVILDSNIYCFGRTGCNLEDWQFFNNPGVSTYDWQSGYQLFTIPITSTGLHTLSFAAVAHSDQEGATALLIDDISVHPVAEPSTLLLLVFGLAGLALWIRRDVLAAVAFRIKVTHLGWLRWGESSGESSPLFCLKATQQIAKKSFFHWATL